MTEGLTDVLNLFLTPPIQASIINGRWVEVCPTNLLDDYSAIDFEISGIGTEFLDLANTFIKVKIHVTAPSGNDGFPQETYVAPVDNLLHSMFHKVDVM